MDAEATFSELFVAAVPRLHAYARYRGCSASDADDLVAATLEVAWRRRGQLPADDPVPWLFAVERNLLRNRWRALRRRDALLARLAPPASADDPAELASDDETVHVRAALAQLDEHDQEILRLVAWDELTPSQAAVVLGCTAVAARSRLHRARARLSSLLERGDLQRGSYSEQRRS